MKASESSTQTASLATHLERLGVQSPLAARLATEIGLGALLAHDEHALRVAGLTAATARRVHAAFGLVAYSRSEPRVSIANAYDTYQIARPIIAFHEQEEFVVFGIDVRNQLMGIVRVAFGTAGGVEVHPRDVFRAAIRMNAAGVVLAHNHPSNDPTPSAEDIRLTERLIEVGKLVSIPVVDHIVVARDGFRSICDVMTPRTP